MGRHPVDEYYSQSHPRQVAMVRTRPDRVLEVGCGHGETLRYFKQAGASLTIGVELDPDAAAVAEAKGGIDQLIVGDLETLDLGFDHDSFDLIIASHVLEHLRDPWTILSELTSYLRPGGHLVGGMPNTRYYRVSGALLFKGQWRYEDTGILDRTHLRFFTRREILELLEGSGLSVDEFTPNFGPLAVRFNRATFGRTQDLLAREFDFLAHKPVHV